MGTFHFLCSPNLVHNQPRRFSPAPNLLLNYGVKKLSGVDNVYLTWVAIQLGVTIVLRMCRLMHSASCFEYYGTIFYFLNPTLSLLSSLYLHKDGLRNIHISVSMQYVVIEAYGYNGRQTLRLVHEKCAGVTSSDSFFLQSIGFAYGILFERCIRVCISSYARACILPKTGGSEKW